MQAIVIAENGEEREFLSYILRHTGLAVARTATVQLVLSSLLKQPVDLVLLSAKSGSAVAEDVAAIRTMSQAPLILLYDPMTEDTKCDLLDAGVDLILERPYSSRILSRYVTMFLRRAGSVPVSMLTAIQSENIQLDPGTRTVTLAGKLPQPLTPLEFRLLYVLMTNADQVIPIDVIIERVWGYNGEGNRELVRGLVRRLRRKIEPDASQTTYIHNHPGVGYRFSI
ncbi:MAG: response regulator transcription factor [Ardenticatenaceae bacterium]|nr:response regulator transcription factor [Anaerolineales bacterium]MCB8937783.1 response regulator transcription factor [Ardenticatenaceae bacterium]MCB8974352.1 response regulator transcription factor [Ardenticatenaceae bacterium]